MAIQKPLDRIKQDDRVQTYGGPGRWVLVCKAWSHEERWMKSTKAMAVPGGVLVQVTTEIVNTAAGGSRSVAEALTFVPGVCLVKDVETGMVSFGELTDVMVDAAVEQSKRDDLPDIPTDEYEKRISELNEGSEQAPEDAADENEIGGPPAESWDEVAE